MRHVRESIVRFAGKRRILLGEEVVSMTFGSKLRKLRTENGLTQEELAKKCFVSRTAVSKWETGRGYPGIDSIKVLSDLFGMSIDSLLSDDDVENRKLLEARQGRQCYWGAMACLALTALFAWLSTLPGLFWVRFPAVVALVGYVLLGILATPRYKRAQQRNRPTKFAVLRFALIGVVVAVALTFLFMPPA